MKIYNLSVEALDSNNLWLQRRIQAEDPGIEPYFSFRGTASWMRALAPMVEDTGFSSAGLSVKYNQIQRRVPTVQRADTSAFQFTFMAFQNLFALSVMYEAHRSSDFLHSAIVSWYYGLYCSAGAMLAAADGSVQEDHRGTANSWDRQIVQNGLILSPFDVCVSTSIKKDCEEYIALLHGGNPFSNDQTSANHEQAIEACLSYFKGTAKYERTRAEERIKTHKDFKDLKVANFRTRHARELRDHYLDNKAVGFLHQAFRYRGKAKYRDALCLGYGTEYTATLEKLLRDMYTVLLAFVRASSHYCSRRVE
jgi:hypothetical protein